MNSRKTSLLHDMDRCIHGDLFCVDPPHRITSFTVILLTADNEGHLGPCRTCPLHAGQGDWTAA